MGVSSLTSFSSLRQARFVSGSISPSTPGCPPHFNAVRPTTQNRNPRLFRRREIFPWRKHRAYKEFLAAPLADLLRPVRPRVLAQAEKVPRIFVRRETEVVEPEYPHARSPVRPFERRFPSQREIRHPFVQPRAKIRPPQEFRRVLPVQRRNAALCLQHFARAAVDFPAHVKRKLRLHAHGASATLCTERQIT